MKALHGLHLATLLAVVVTASAAAREDVRGYLRETIDVTDRLPAPPAEGDARAAQDRRVHGQTRALLAGARGDLARADQDTSSRHMFDVFACSLELSLTPGTAPATVALLRRTCYETMRSSTAAKQVFKRPRPAIRPGEPICAADGMQGEGYDYPSGHATLGWTWAQILSRVDPAQAKALRARGQAYGDSRIICGAHHASGVAAGRQAAIAALSVVAREPAFLRDLDAARREIAALRALLTTPRPDPTTCRREASVIAAPVVTDAATLGPPSPARKRQ